MSDIPDRVRIRTRLTAAKVNNYWRVLNMSQQTWLSHYTLPERYETVLDDLLNKLEMAEGILDDLEETE